MKAHKRPELTLEDDPLWYKSAIIYELHVRAFSDSNGDGIGDFKGLTEKLDYLQDLGINAVWLLPFYPSPLKDDGYDIADYRHIHESYGNMNDCKRFIREAHKRGIRVITELVINHTSDEHAWFKRAKKAEPNSTTRNFYVWSENPDKYSDARIIFKDFEHSNWTWDPDTKTYYWHRFYSHQPDLNYENPAVKRAIVRVLDYWLKLGVDGLRLDAIPYLYEREGTNCENLPETHQFLKEFRAHVEKNFKNRMLLAEANQWPEDAVAYFGEGDESHMNFHFPLMPRLFMSIRLEDRFPIIDILEQTPSIPENCQWALFLRNHDELTLEMVTEEERDYMYRVYANDPRSRINLGIRRRLAPLLQNNRRKIELMNGLLFSLPGTPVLYYGDEIGMGDNIYLGDRDGVRTPMQWSADRNAGFSRANPQSLYLPVIIDPEYHYESLNVEAQQNNPSSLLWWMKRLIALRKRFRAFGHGSLEFLHPENPKVLAFLRQYEEETILVVANLSRFFQCVELDLSEYKEMIPVELFGRTKFPPIGDLPYFITLGPHNFLWFSLEPRHHVQETIQVGPRLETTPGLVVSKKWSQIFEDRRIRQKFEEDVLPLYLRTRRWFGGKARPIRVTEIVETVACPFQSSTAYLVLLKVHYTQGDPEIYLLTVAYTAEETHFEELSSTKIADLQVRATSEEGILYDPILKPDFSQALLNFIAQRRQLEGEAGEVTGSSTQQLSRIVRKADGPLEANLGRAEQSNTSIIFEDQLILKLFRRLDDGINPDLELCRFLTQKRFPNIPSVTGSLEYTRHKGSKMTLGILQVFVPNQGDAWKFTLDALNRYYERALAERTTGESPTLPRHSFLDLVDQEIPEPVSERIGLYLESARLLGQRTAELHLTLASEREDPAFAPEPYNSFARRSLYQSMRNQSNQVLRLLRRQADDLPEDIRSEAHGILDLRNEILEVFADIKETPISTYRIRCHGDYHLGQVLFTGKDFVIIDFEGEPARPMSERRLKRSSLQDVAGMLRSFHYAVYASLFNQVEAGLIRPDELSELDPWVRYWHSWVSVIFMKSYLKTAQDSPIVPADAGSLHILLRSFLLNKAVYELGYELNNRPGWLKIPIEGIREIMNDSAQR